MDFKIITAGIDIGTTKVAAVIVDTETRSVLASSSLKTDAKIVTDKSVKMGYQEQDVRKILDALTDCIRVLPPEFRQKVEAISRA